VRGKEREGDGVGRLEGEDEWGEKMTKGVGGEVIGKAGGMGRKEDGRRGK